MYGVYIQYSYILFRLKQEEDKKEKEDKLKNNKFHIPVYTNVPKLPTKKEK